jgi:hypothetical protein
VDVPDFHDETFGTVLNYRLQRQEPGLYAADAKWTLRSWRNGTLNLDW